MNNKNEDVYVFPTTFPQRQIWFIHQINKESPAYNIPFAYDINGDLNVAVLENAVNEIISRHEAFRTVFSETDDGLMQVIFPELKIEVLEFDFTDKVLEIDEFIRENSILPFDLANGPLIRSSVVKKSKSEYILLLNFHHVILDHISIVQFADELKVIYKAFSENAASPLVKPELQYADYAVWQNNHQNYEFLKPKMDFWIDQLKEKNNYLDLPLDMPRPSFQLMEGKEYILKINRPLTDKLKAFSRSESVSMFITLLTAYSTLFHRYTSQDDVTVGTPFANRGFQPELEKVMGCFINTLPIVSDFSCEPTFKEALKRIRSNVFAVAGHQETPFEMIIEAVQPVREASYNPIFQVGFTYQEPPMEIELEGCDVKSQCLHNESAKFDILSWLWECDEGIKGLLEYNSSIFKYSTIERFAGHYSTLLAGIVENPDAKLYELPILTEAEKSLFESWNDTSADYDSSILLHQRFEKLAISHPDKIALEFEGETISYFELDKRATEYAKYIVTLGIQPGSYVGVYMLRSIEMMVAIYSILKSGGAYIPIDPDYPEDRINYIISDASLEYFLTHEKVNSDSINVKHKIFIDADIHNSDSYQDCVLPSYSSDNTAYVIYTSGTTGKPKGVMISHKSITNRLEWMQDEYKLNEDDVVLQKTPYSFDVSVWELFWPLMYGARLQIAKPDGHKDPFYLKELIKSKNITTVHFVPSMLRAFISVESFKECDLLKRVFCSGEALPYDLTQLFFDDCAAELHNLYGPTEAAVDVTYWECDREDTRNFVPIGMPVSNTQLYVLDKNLNQVPVGISGELHIGGAQVAKGYLNKDELTKEKFIQNIFSSDSNSKLYKTGDLVRYRDTGEIEYIGRNDFQVKVRGFRIELGEIESVLVKQEGIDQAVVVVSEERPGDPRLVAYIIVDEGVTVTATSVRNMMRDNLPDYMMPQHFIELESLPLTSNGKVDRKALPSAFSDIDSTNNEDDLPRTYAEQQIAEIWASVLNIDNDHISVYDNFFEIGGHSLLSLQVIVRIKDLTGVKLNPRIIILNSLKHIAEQSGFAEESLNQTATGSVQSEQKHDKKNTSTLRSIFRKFFHK